MTPDNVSNMLAQLASLRAERDARIADLAAQIERLEDAITSSVLEFGDVITGSDGRLKAIICEGRITYDAKGLDGFAVACQAVLKFRKVGKPYCQIRPVPQKASQPASIVLYVTESMRR